MFPSLKIRYDTASPKHCFLQHRPKAKKLEVAIRNLRMVLYVVRDTSHDSVLGEGGVPADTRRGHCSGDGSANLCYVPLLCGRRGR